MWHWRGIEVDIYFNFHFFGLPTRVIKWHLINNLKKRKNIKIHEIKPISQTSPFSFSSFRNQVCLGSLKKIIYSPSKFTLLFFFYFILIIHFPFFFFSSSPIQKMQEELYIQEIGRDIYIYNINYNCWKSRNA